MTRKIILSGSVLWKPPYVITNEELVEAYNGYAEKFNRENAKHQEHGELEEQPF